MEFFPLQSSCPFLKPPNVWTRKDTSQTAFGCHSIMLMQGPFFLKTNAGIELRSKRLNKSKAVRGGKSTQGLWCEKIPRANLKDIAASSTGKDAQCLRSLLLPSFLI